ncbi:hypothetical protein [Sphingomonas rubra]|nr:hypothetical protein [Sphingomonas rubra]
MSNAATEALQLAQASPFPISSGGDSLMFAASLFAVCSITFLLTMRLIATVRQMWIDRKVKTRDTVWWFRLTIVLLCCAGLISRAPDMVYKIAWGEVTPATLHIILSVKEWSNAVAFFIVMGWIGILTYFEPLWTLKLSNPLNMVWGGDTRKVSRFFLIVFLTGLLAGAITLSKAF